MYTLQKKIFFIFVSVIIVLVVNFGYAEAQNLTATPSGTQASGNAKSIEDLNNKIHELESKVSDLRSQEDSLTSQIGVMDSQIKLTEYKINATNQQIKDVEDDIGAASKRMKNLEGSLSKVTKVLLSRIIATYQNGNVDTMQLVLSSKDPSEMLSKINYMQIVQEHDKRLLYDTQQAKNDYANQKNIFEDKKKRIEALQNQLEEYNKQLDQQKEAKKKLLSDTQGSEANYSRLLSQARAQLASFTKFTQSQGGASILTGQTACDGWGCYYNQRDASWGGLSLNGTEYTIASDGCLVTSMAMMMTHYGYKVTPADINANSNNFASYYPAYLLFTISAGGATAQRVGASLDASLESGNPVVVGIRHPSGGTHFLVIKSKSNGQYIMNDPYTPGGHDINFSDYYSVGSIFEIDRVAIL